MPSWRVDFRLGIYNSRPRPADRTNDGSFCVLLCRGRGMRLTWPLCAPSKGAHFEALHTDGVSVPAARLSVCTREFICESICERERGREREREERRGEGERKVNAE